MKLGRQYGMTRVGAELAVLRMGRAQCHYCGSQRCGEDDVYNAGRIVCCTSCIGKRGVMDRFDPRIGGEGQ